MNVSGNRNRDFLDAAAGERKLPVIWLLTDDRPGHTTQVIGVAKALAGTTVRKSLAFNVFNYLPNPLLGASLASLTPKARAEIAPPYPDLVLGMGRRVAPVARWIMRESKGRTKAVLLGRKVAASTSDDELVVRLAHFGHGFQKNECSLLVPPTQVDAMLIDAIRSRDGDPMDDIPRPHVVLLVGGPTAQHQFDARFAYRLARDIAGAAAEHRGGLAIVTSRRTPAVAIEAMKRSAPAAHVHEWQADRLNNPYLTYLAHADYVVVTGESESMLAEAVAAGKPLTIYPLVARTPGTKQRLGGWVVRTSHGSGTLSQLCRSLLAKGWITPPRDLSEMHRLMVERGLARLFSRSLNTVPPAPYDDLVDVVSRITRMLGPAGQTRR